VAIIFCDFSTPFELIQKRIQQKRKINAPISKREKMKE